MPEINQWVYKIPPDILDSVFGVNLDDPSEIQQFLESFKVLSTDFSPLLKVKVFLENRLEDLTGKERER